MTYNDYERDGTVDMQDATGDNEPYAGEFAPEDSWSEDGQHVLNMLRSAAACIGLIIIIGCVIAAVIRLW